ncbi:MAG: DUF4269 domain-containing protein [Thermonemataceae bacterium]
MLPDFTDISYLAQGTPIQREVYQSLKALKINEVLQAYHPIVVGTFPIDLAVEGSDIDVICCCKHINTFEAIVRTTFAHLSHFQQYQIVIQKLRTSISQFEHQGFTYEIFAQNKPTKAQEAYRHMVIEAQILASKGEKFKRKVLKLKEKGYKTEPTFAKLLGLKGNPYEALLQVSIAEL